ncbi:MAG TPA: hypothetical protein VNT60_08890 [Deinococcales bacterium]|nr:hypothetical protein [Deinococcales bacterium]
MRPTDCMTNEQLLADARTDLHALRQDGRWAAYSAARPGRVVGVETLLSTIHDLEFNHGQRGSPAPRSVAVNVWRLSQRHSASLDEFAAARRLGSHSRA